VRPQSPCAPGWQSDFSAILQDAGALLAKPIPIDTVLSITGLCVTRSWPTESQVTILARSADDIEVLQAAPLWMRNNSAGVHPVSLQSLWCFSHRRHSHPKNRLLRMRNTRWP
jgi:hypothetical protein